MQLWSVAVNAAVEELVYRAWLPAAIARCLRSTTVPTTLVVALAAQFTFAVSHLAVGDGLRDSHTLLGLLTLTGAGIFLQCIQRVAGLPLAIATHTLVNVGVLCLAAPTRDRSLGVVAVLVAAGLLALFAILRIRYPSDRAVPSG